VTPGETVNGKLILTGFLSYYFRRTVLGSLLAELKQLSFHGLDFRFKVDQVLLQAGDILIPG